MAPYFSFPAPSISSMGNESLSTEPPGSNHPLLQHGPEAPTDTDSQSKDGNATVTVLPANGPATGRPRKGVERITNTAAYRYLRRLNPVRLITGPIEAWRAYFVEKKEVPKVVIHKGVNGPWLAHTWVHIPPVVATAVLLVLNLWLYPNAKLRGHYIGPTCIGTFLQGDLSDEAKMNWLQFAAKLHEITLVASLSTVVWDMVRYFLVYKPLGVPLGLIGAGSAFTEIKFIFSKELHGVWRMDYGMGAKISVFATIAMFCLLANLAGPSSAILMIPRNGTWPVAEFRFSLAGTADKDLWPSVLTKDHIGITNCTDPDGFKTPACVSGAYHPINNYFRSFAGYPVSNSFDFNAVDDRTSRTLKGITRLGYHTETWTMAPHAAAVAVHEELRSTWNMRLDRAPLNYGYSLLRTIEVDAMSPMVRSACVPARGLWSKTFNRSGVEVFPMDFPVLKRDQFWEPDVDVWFGNGETGQVFLNASLLDLADIVDNRDFVVKTHWVTLPDDFGDESIGLVILNSAAYPGPGLPHGPRFDLGIACAIDARWAPSGNIAETSKLDWARGGYKIPTRSVAHNLREPPDDSNGRNFGDRLFLPGREEDKWKQITLSEDWSNALTPPIPGRAGNASTLDAIFEDTIPNIWAVAGANESLWKQMYFYHGEPLRPEIVVLAEHVSASLVADGLSRVGLGLQPMIWELSSSLWGDFHRPKTDYDPDYFSLGIFDLASPYNRSDGTPLTMKASVYGYGLRLEGISGIFAVAVLCLHIIVVILHILCLFFVFGNQTMATWKTSTEFMLLGMGSASNRDFDDETLEMLRYGGVGAERAATFGSLVRIEALTDGSAPVQEVRLRLGKGTAGMGKMEHGRTCIVSGADN